MCQPLVNWWPSLALGLEVVEPQHVHTEPIQKDQKDPLEADPWVGLPVPRVDAKRALMLWPSLGLEKCSNPEHVKTRVGYMVYHGLPIRMHDYAIVTMIHHDTFEICEAPQPFFALSIYMLITGPSGKDCRLGRSSSLDLVTSKGLPINGFAAMGCS